MSQGTGQAVGNSKTMGSNGARGWQWAGLWGQPSRGLWNNLKGPGGGRRPDEKNKRVNQWCLGALGQKEHNGAQQGQAVGAAKTQQNIL